MEIEDLLLLRQRQPISGERLPLFIVGDGAMGTELLGGGASHPLDRLNLTQPEAVQAIHASYRAAGSEILTTNSFGANRFRLALHGRESEVREMNLSAARLAHEAGDGALVAGSIGPSGVRRNLPYEQLEGAFAEQAAALADGGIDLFWCETFGDVEELRCAVLGIRRVSDLPVVALVTYTAEARTPSGATPSDVAHALSDLPLAAIGVNCAMGHGTVERVIHELRRSTELPLVAQPNAGTPSQDGAELHYPLDPAGFADLAVRLFSFVAIIAGCCGTSPTHIAAAREALRLTRTE